MLLSLVIGVIFSVLGIHPGDLIDGIRRLIERIYYLGFDAIREALSYFLLGAIVVFPIWFLLRLFKVIGGRSNGS